VTMYTRVSYGNGPIILSVPHDGKIAFPEAAIREEAKLWIARNWGEMRDEETLILARHLERELGTRGVYASTVSFGLHRSHVDVNREPDNEPFAKGFVKEYEMFHRALDLAIELSLTEFGECLLIDVHGFATSPGPEKYDIVLGTDRHKTCRLGLDKTIARHLGNVRSEVLGRPYKAVFSPDETQNISARYRGGWITRRVAEKSGQHGLEAIQLEFNTHIRQKPLMAEVANHLAFILAGWPG
jgi:N-formylglutamate amidohydrolase